MLVEELYGMAGLDPADGKDYGDRNELEFFMAINLCRHDPAKLIIFVTDMYKTGEPWGDGKGKKMDALVAKLKSLKKNKLP